MPVGDLLNWDFIMPRYTEEQWENIIKELEKRYLRIVDRG